MARRFSERLRLHNENPRTNHLAPHHTLSLGMHISEEDVMLFTYISTRNVVQPPFFVTAALKEIRKTCFNRLTCRPVAPAGI